MGIMKMADMFFSVNMPRFYYLKISSVLLNPDLFVNKLLQLRKVFFEFVFK
jgi:hypothetical protein